MEENKFEVGKIYEDYESEGVCTKYVCTRRTESYTYFDIYKQGNFINSDRRKPSVPYMKLSEEVKIYGYKRLSSGICRKHIQPGNEKFERMIEALISAEIVEVYKETDENKKTTYYCKISRKEYTKPFWFYADKDNLGFDVCGDAIEGVKRNNEQYGKSRWHTIEKIEIDEDTAEKLLRQILKNFTFYKNSTIKGGKNYE